MQMAQEAHKRIHGGHKEALSCSQDGPRSLQDVSKALNTAARDSKMASQGTNVLQKGFQKRSKGVKRGG